MQAEGRDVEDRADRADEDHEASDIAGFPLARLLQVILVHAVPRDRQLGDVVEQVLDQELQRQHRQERQERARHQHAEDVAEVRAGRHLDVLDDVAEGLATLHDAFFEHQQALLQQDDVGGFLGDVGGGIDRNADIRIAQRRSIVDAVAEKADGVAVGLQHPDDARFLQRRDFGEHRRAFDKIAKRRHRRGLPYPGPAPARQPRDRPRGRSCG